MNHVHPVEQWFNVFKLVNEKGQLELIKSECKDKKEAEDWIEENALAKHYYVILETYRRQ